LLLTNYIKGNFFLDKKPLVNTYEYSSKYKFNDNLTTTYSFENLSDGTYVSDDQLSAITILSSTNDDTEAESKHDMFPIDEYTNFDNINNESEFIPHQLFDINNQSINENFKDGFSNNINHEIISNTSLLKEKSFLLNLNNNDYMNSNRDDLLDINIFYNKEKDGDERNSTKSNYGINDDTYINSDNNDNQQSFDDYIDHYYSSMDYDEEHYQNLRDIDSQFGKHLNDDNTILSGLYNSDVSDICSEEGEESDLDIIIDESCHEEEDSDDNVEIIIASELPTPPPSFYKKMAEIRKSKKAMNSENENVINNNGNNSNNSNNNGSSFSSSKRHKKHKYNRNSHSKYNKSSSKSSHCEPSTISIDDYIDHSANAIFSSNNNKKKKNSKHFNKSKNSSSVNNSNSASTGSENKSKSINHVSARDENNELSTSWPSLASLYLSNNTKTNNKKVKETPSNTHIDSSSTNVGDHTITSNKDKIKPSNTNSSYPEKFSYISLLSHIKENPKNSSVQIQKPSENSSSLNLDEEQPCSSYDASNNDTIPLEEEKKYVDYVITSKNTTTCVTSVTPSLFFINCPDSVKDMNSSFKNLNFFAQDSDNEFDSDRNEKLDESDLLTNIRKDDFIISTPKKSNLTEGLSQSTLVATPTKQLSVSSSISCNTLLDETNYSASISSTSTSSIPPLLINSNLSSSATSHNTTSSSLSISNLDHIPYQFSTSPNSQIAISFPSLSSNFTISDSSLIIDINDLELDCPTPLPPSETKLANESTINLSDAFMVSKKSDSSVDNADCLSNHSSDTAEISYSLDSHKITSSLEQIKKTTTAEMCACKCNSKNHFCSFVDRKFKLNREKRRLIKSAINCGFIDIHLKDDPNPCEEEDENNSNCDAQSPSSHSKYKNKEEENENEREDIINTILLSHTDFSTFPSHLKFTVNTHDVWLKWTNLEINKDRFKDGRLL